MHAILDGRDVASDSGREDLRELQRELDVIGVGEIVTVSGRYWAMDRDRRWGKNHEVLQSLDHRRRRSLLVS